MHGLHSRNSGSKYIGWPGILAALALFTFFALPPAETALAGDPTSAAVGPPAPESAGEQGLWPSPRMMRLLLQRWADDVSADFELSQRQREDMNRQFVDRWADFLEENRLAIQPLFNDFLEMRMAPEPPDKGRVQAWADRAAPIFDRIRIQVDESNRVFREILTPSQRLRFEAETLQLSAGMHYLESRLKAWRGGEFQEGEFWDPPRRIRRERRRDRGQSSAGAPRATAAANAPQAATIPADAVAAELERWDSFVRDAVAQFGFDEGQRATALSCLAELKERAVSHRDRHRSEIDALERRIHNQSGSAAELEEIRLQLVRLYGPIDDLFAELRRRVESIPTQAQRERMLDAGNASP